MLTAPLQTFGLAKFEGELSEAASILQAMLALVAALAVLSVAPQTSAQDDVDYLNFALQLECLEASFYSYAAFGINLSPALLGKYLVLSRGSFSLK